MQIKTKCPPLWSSLFVLVVPDTNVVPDVSAAHPELLMTPVL